MSVPQNTKLTEVKSNREPCYTSMHLFLFQKGGFLDLCDTLHVQSRDKPMARASAPTGYIIHSNPWSTGEVQ